VADLERAVAADDHEAVEAQLPDVGKDERGHVLGDLPAVDRGLMRERIAAVRRAEDGPAHEEDARVFHDVSWRVFVGLSRPSNRQ